MTRARLKGIDTADWEASIERYHKDGMFKCYFQASIGPDDADGAEVFGFTACNREWLDWMIESNGDLPKFIVLDDVNFGAVERAAEIACAAVPQGSWEDVSRKLAETMDWEFDGYISV